MGVMKNKTQKTVSRKIGLNRGKSRLWLEGVALAEKWKRGDRFDIEFDTANKQIVIRRSLEGKRGISGKNDRPIIDTNSDKITETLCAQVGDRTEIIISNDVILIKKK